MSTPTIHLPDVAHVDLSDVTDRAGDAWSSGIEKVQDLAVAAFDLAGDLAAAAAERIEDLPEKAITLAGAAIPALRPAPKRSKKPFIIAAVLLAVLAGAWWMRRRRSAGPEAPYISSADRTEGAVSAAS
jgi:MYXO-CTERM domain-containing protein